MSELPSPIRTTAADRLAALRAELAGRGLDGFVVPHADAHQGEYLPARDERLAWLTGFTGSAGAAAVLAERAALFVDGRYTLQAAAQVDATLYEQRHLIREPMADWLGEHLGAGARLGYDPWLHSLAEMRALERVCERTGAELVAVDGNPVDAVWPDQPLPPAAPAVAHPLRHAGRAAADKRADIAAALDRAGVDAAVLTATESTAWLLNLRGRDVPNVPVVLAFSVIHADGSVDLVIDPAKVDDAVAAHLGDGVRIHPPGDFGAVLDRLGEGGRRVALDPGQAPAWIARRLEAAGAAIREARDPAALPRALKNEVEVAGMRAAHIRDGAALCRFLAWFAATAPGGGLTEMAAADRLLAFRRENDLFAGPSFDTISGAGPNGAIVHYRVTAETDREIRPGDVYLVDSGGQYLDGTTDVTRTLAVGDVPDEARRRFTQVLKGHIAVATARFPAGTTGTQIDPFARRYLWRDGVDYDHGTGHGVGSYLRVHEGPHAISPRPNPTALQPGMIVSNEPGYYRTGAYGIRIENLVVVVEVAPAVEEGGDARNILGFETLTLAPIDRAMIATDLLDDDERAWLDAYHARVRDTVGPLVDEATRRWLAGATAPIAT